MRVLLVFAGGNGDVLSATAILPGVMAQYPGAEIFVAAPLKYSSLIAHDPRFQILPYGASADGYDAVIPCWHGGQWDAQMPIVQCRVAQVPFSFPQMFFAPGEIEQARGCDVAICSWTSSASARRYARFADLAQLLAKHLDAVQIDNGPSLGIEQPPLTLREAAAVAARSRLLLTLDTSLMHVGIALQHPMRVVFNLSHTGPFNQLVHPSQVSSTLDDPARIAREVHLHLERFGGCP